MARDTDVARSAQVEGRFSRTPFHDSGQRFLAGRFGIGLFLLSLGMLFGATLIAFLVLRLRIGDAWPELPPLPPVLWISTAIILLSSVTMQAGVVAIRHGRAGTLRIAMTMTLLLGVVFLVLQSMAWLEWIPAAAERWDQSNEWRFALTCFYVFTGLHALHVVGGLIPMAVITQRAFANRYDASHHSGVQFCAMYWHFLDGVWLALFATLMIGV